MPIDPRTMAALKAKGLHLEYQPETGITREIQDTSSAIQFIGAIDPMGRTNHASYHRLLEIAKDKKQKPEVTIVSCKRIVDPKLGKEFATFTLQISTLHYDETTAISDTWRDYGIWYEPTFRRVYNGKKSRWEDTDEVSGSITHHDYLWSPKLKIKDPLDGKTVPLEDMISSETRFFMIRKGMKITVDRDAWLTASREELEAKYGGVNPQV
jgi:hypothetical protein